MEHASEKMHVRRCFRKIRRENKFHLERSRVVISNDAAAGILANTWNMPPSHIVSDGPKTVATQTHAFASSTPKLTPSGLSCFTRSCCCIRKSTQLSETEKLETDREKAMPV